jgi:DNA-binding XRE family transcriptional regulator
MKKELAKLIRQQRRELGLNGESQQKLLRKVRDAFELTNEELAEALGVPPDTLLAYLAPESARKYRQMAEADRLVLARILGKRKKR